ncbi:DnaJ domain-containing protein [Desulfobacula sp.]|uniref:DnaJ domain-containing protein n=1 Tax=Desulfobacula sp. TaxID=2593537 RepID=UPI0026224AD7|nr:DnaJ domain-containing protein [Desulfobacula sp.]
MPKDYYLVLGITSEATLDDIKDAYRRLAKEYHPDHYGKNHSPFLAIQEAYSVLSDPIKRQTHDLEVLNQKKKLKPRYGESIRFGRKGHVEPMIPNQEAPMDLGTASLARSFHSCRPSFDELFDRIFSNFRQTSRPGSEQKENFNVVITLTPEQAFWGGQIKVALPAQLTCPSCFGQGRVGVYECRRCNGDGILSGEYPVMISYPAGISDNHVVRMQLDTYGIKNLYLTVHFRVSKLF